MVITYGAEHKKVKRFDGHKCVTNGSRVQQTKGKEVLEKSCNSHNDLWYMMCTSAMKSQSRSFMLKEVKYFVILKV